MAVLRVYWSVALKQPLADLCNATQTLPLSKHGAALVQWAVPTVTGTAKELLHDDKTGT